MESSVSGSPQWQVLQSATVQQDGTVQVTAPMTQSGPTLIRVRGTNTPCGSMVLIPAGSFQMGDSFSEGEWDEVPVHSVYVSAFYMDKYEVSKALWDEVYDWATNHGYSFEYGAQGVAANHPAYYMPWSEAVKWCNARSEKEGKTPAYYTDAGLTQRYRAGLLDPYVNWSAGYRLPTEAEWEKAARGGTNGHRFPWTDTDTITHSRANFSSVSASYYPYDVSPTRGFHPSFNEGTYPYTSPVGYFAPNGYGLYDMAGNVWEWCWDWHAKYSSAAQSDPRGPSTGSTGSFRVFRGGDWGYNAYYCRTALRGPDALPSYGASTGLRSVLPAGQ